MEIRLRFPLKRPISVDDHWALDANGAVLSFETNGPQVTALLLTFQNQPPQVAPQIVMLPPGPVKARIDVNGGIEALGRRIVQRFTDFANLYFSIDVDIDAMEAEYIPTDDRERTMINVFGIKAEKKRPIIHVPFSMLAQAYVAAESSDDPSFAARMYNLAREALLNEQYIDSFRYSFLLFEALYGGGQFKSRELIRALLGDIDFKRMLDETMIALNGDSLYANSPARPLVKACPSAESLVAHLVDRRGFYFHGNQGHSKAWHPDRQDEAKPLAELCIQIGMRVSQSYASAMFEPAIEERLFDNAKRYGAIMSIEVEFQIIDPQNLPRTRKIKINAPGTVATSRLAVAVNKQFLEWAELQLSDCRLVACVARDTTTGSEIFRSQYLLANQASAPGGE